MPETFYPLPVKMDEDPERFINDNFTLIFRILNDIEGWIIPSKQYELRNTYVFSDQDSLDASYPFEMDFEIVSEMIVIKNVKLSFRIREFRAYATTVPSGGGHTSGATGSASGGGSTSGSATHDHAGSTAQSAQLYHAHNISIPQTAAETNYVQVNANLDGLVARDIASTATIPTQATGVAHSHSLNITSDGAHAHSTPNHTHPNHTHTVSNHTHNLTFGIYEDSQSPTIHYHVDNGSGYGAASSNYNSDQLDIDITSSITGTGFKRIKFDSDVRTRISGWVLCKVDLIA